MGIDTLAGFHPGELDVQCRAGVTAEASRLAGMLAPADMTGGPANFLAQREFAVLTARDHDGMLWTSPLLGPAGFLAADRTTLRVHGAPDPSDPLRGLAADQQVGLLAVEFARRRRMRVNGLLTAVGPHELTIEAEQAYGNCPAYLQQRILEPTAVANPSSTATRSTTLTAAARALIRGADTFFVGTTHPTRGADASHKGGRPGFVRVDGDDVWWPDYAGNNMFNSLGNISVDPSAALLFVDFSTGARLHLSGTAELEWLTPGAPGDDGGTGRRIHFHPTVIVEATPLPIHADGVRPSPHNPTLAA